MRSLPRFAIVNRRGYRAKAHISRALRKHGATHRNIGGREGGGAGDEGEGQGELHGGGGDDNIGKENYDHSGHMVHSSGGRSLVGVRF